MNNNQATESFYLSKFDQNEISFLMEDLLDLHESFETLILSIAKVIELLGLALIVILNFVVTLFNETFAKNQDFSRSWLKETLAFFPSEGQANISKEVVFSEHVIITKLALT